MIVYRDKCVIWLDSESLKGTLILVSVKKN